MRYQLASAPAGVVGLLPTFIASRQVSGALNGLRFAGNATYEVETEYSPSMDVMTTVTIAPGAAGGSDVEVAVSYGRGGQRFPAHARLDAEFQQGVAEWLASLDAFVAARTPGRPTPRLAQRGTRIGRAMAAPDGDFAL